MNYNVITFSLLFVFLSGCRHQETYTYITPGSSKAIKIKGPANILNKVFFEGTMLHVLESQALSDEQKGILERLKRLQKASHETFKINGKKIKAFKDNVNPAQLISWVLTGTIKDFDTPECFDIEYLNDFTHLITRLFNNGFMDVWEGLEDKDELYKDAVYYYSLDELNRESYYLSALYEKRFKKDGAPSFADFLNKI